MRLYVPCWCNIRALSPAIETVREGTGTFHTGLCTVTPLLLSPPPFQTKKKKIKHTQQKKHEGKKLRLIVFTAKKNIADQLLGAKDHFATHIQYQGLQEAAHTSGRIWKRKYRTVDHTETEIQSAWQMTAKAMYRHQLERSSVKMVSLVNPLVSSTTSTACTRGRRIKMLLLRRATTLETTNEYDEKYQCVDGYEIRFLSGQRTL